MYRLMVVEDEEAIRRGFIEQIRWENYGFSVVGEASNGREALDLIPRLRPDVILVDIMMPVMTGLELISHMNKHFPKIKSVVISGYSDFEYARKSLEYGVSYYLLKPTKDEEIRRVFLSLKESLDLVTNKDRQYEIIERKARESEPYLQEHLFKRLIASECTTGEWREIINTGLLPADTERYGAAVAQANDANEAEPVSLSHLYKSATLASWIGQYASSSEGVPKIYPIFNDDGTMTILCFAGREDAGYFHGLLARFSRWIENLIRDDVSGSAAVVTVGMGNFHAGAGGFARSLIEARESPGFRFFRGLGQVIVPDSARGLDDKYAEALERFNRFDSVGRIVHNTMIGRIDLVLEAIDRYGELIAGLRAGDQELVLLKVMEILLSFSKRLGDMGMDAASIYSRNTHQVIRRIISEKTLDHLIAKLKSICLQIIGTIYGDSRNVGFDPVMEKAKQYILENYYKKITLEDMCKITYLSPSHFCSLFKKYTGSTFIAYLTRMRIAKAKELLAESNYKVYEVAVMMGYEDFRYFSKTFKKYEGINPRQYREKLSAVR